MVGAALASVGAAMLVLGVLDGMGIMRLMGTSPAFLGVCMLLVGGLLVIITRAESTGDEDEPETTADGVRRVTADPEDVFETQDPFVAGRVGPGGAARARRGSSAPASSTSTSTAVVPVRASATESGGSSPPPPPHALPEPAPVTAADPPRAPRVRAGANDDGAPPAGAPLTARRRRR